MIEFGLLGAGVVFGLAAIGSGLGIGVAGMALVGAWKKCFLANKAAPMVLLAFAGNPLSQTFYGFILMGQLKNAALANPGSMLYLGFGLAAGASLLFTAIVCQLPADTEITSFNPDTCTGVFLVNVVPSPKRPSPFCPQAHTVPLLFNATV